MVERFQGSGVGAGIDPTTGRKSKSFEESKHLSPKHGAGQEDRIEDFWQPAEVRSEGGQGKLLLSNSELIGAAMSSGGTSASSSNPISYNKGDFEREFTSLTKVDKGKDDQVRKYVTALKALEERGVVKSVGSDKKGVQHFLIFAFAFPKGDDAQADKDAIIEDMKSVFLYICET